MGLTLLALGLLILGVLLPQLPTGDLLGGVGAAITGSVGWLAYAAVPPMLVLGALFLIRREPPGWPRVLLGYVLLIAGGWAFTAVIAPGGSGTVGRSFNTFMGGAAGVLGGAAALLVITFGVELILNWPLTTIVRVGSTRLIEFLRTSFQAGLAARNRAKTRANFQADVVQERIKLRDLDRDLELLQKLYPGSSEVSKWRSAVNTTRDALQKSPAAQTLSDAQLDVSAWQTAVAGFTRERAAELGAALANEGLPGFDDWLLGVKAELDETFSEPVPPAKALDDLRGALSLDLTAMHERYRRVLRERDLAEPALRDIRPRDLPRFQAAHEARLKQLDQVREDARELDVSVKALEQWRELAADIFRSMAEYGSFQEMHEYSSTLTRELQEKGAAALSQLDGWFSALSAVRSRAIDEERRLQEERRQQEQRAVGERLRTLSGPAGPGATAASDKPVVRYPRDLSGPVSYDAGSVPAERAAAPARPEVVHPRPLPLQRETDFEAEGGPDGYPDYPAYDAAAQQPDDPQPRPLAGPEAAGNADWLAELERPPEQQAAEPDMQQPEGESLQPAPDRTADRTPDLSQLILDESGEPTPSDPHDDYDQTPARHEPRPQPQLQPQPQGGVLDGVPQGRSVVDEPEVPPVGGIPIQLPPYSLLDMPELERESPETLQQELQERVSRIDETLANFRLEGRVVASVRGPTVTRFEVEPAPGEKISRFANLSDDLALAMAASSVRIEAPIPGKSVIGLEVPNAHRDLIRFREAAEAQSFRRSKARLPLILGKSIDGEMVVGDLARMPHLLIAGSTGSGKSVAVNTLVGSLLYKFLPTELRFLMIDPKMVELTPYDGIPHLLRPVVTNPNDAAAVLLGAVSHMERRYKMMSKIGAKNLDQYNEKALNLDLPQLPFVVIIIDELADLMITSPKEVESAIMRLAQMARATGMHLVLATQRPSVDILTSLIKVNVPARIAFAVSSGHDSRTILDTMGAERLVGMGDMLHHQPGLVKPVRLQGPFISETEISELAGFLRRQFFEDEFVEAYGEDFDPPSLHESEADGFVDWNDEKLRVAAEMVIQEGQASVSRLQRRLQVGHARAGKLMDSLEALGVVGPHTGSKPRDVLVDMHELPNIFGR